VAGPDMLPFCWLLTEGVADEVELRLLILRGSMIGDSRS
jgi:hypothetical protein